MAWSVEYTDELEAWWNGLTESAQEEIDAVVGLLVEYGVDLPFPYSSSVNESRHSHMRELRVQHQGKPLRILYAFDPLRAAILLIGGDKTGDKRWYKVYVPIADRLYDEHIEELKREGRCIVMSKPYSMLRNTMSPEARARAEEKTRQFMANMPLQELRQARRISQVQLAKSLHTRQSNVSRIEKRTDMYISTLRDVIKAMGGDLEIVARFPDGNVRISQFEELDQFAVSG